MKTIPLEQFTSLDRTTFFRFLEECRNEARRLGEGQILSISRPVDHLDPLAILDSIYEGEEPHFYLERPSGESSVAGAEAVVSASIDGPDRFSQARAWADELFARATLVGSPDLPWAGPHLFACFTFFPSPGETSGFPGAMLFLPRWQVGGQEGRYTATANLLLEPESDVRAIGERVWAAHEKFSSFRYPENAPSGSVDRAGPDSPPTVSEVGGPDAFPRAVAQAIAEIRAGTYDKVVLARALDFSFASPLRPLRALDLLRREYPSCFNFSFAPGGHSSLVGATPERLLRTIDGALRTEAIAGSAGRGSTAGEDARRAAELLRSTKDLHEHQIVIEAIERRLREAGLEPEREHGPRLLTLPNVHHLQTPLRAALSPTSHPLDLLARLHPTPAVGGKPLAPALDAIQRLESFPRGPYAGTIGWLNARGQSDFIVAIRSALIRGHDLRLYAGAGIVADSDPQCEWAETEIKFRALREAFALRS